MRAFRWREEWKAWTGTEAFSESGSAGEVGFCRHHQELVAAGE